MICTSFFFVDRELVINNSSCYAYLLCCPTDCVGNIFAFPDAVLSIRSLLVLAWSLVHCVFLFFVFLFMLASVAVPVVAVLSRVARIRASDIGRVRGSFAGRARGGRAGRGRLFGGPPCRACGNRVEIACCIHGRPCP